jgi:hypothetical protein
MLTFASRKHKQKHETIYTNIILRGNTVFRSHFIDHFAMGI